MEKLPELKKQSSVAVYQPKAGQMAIDVRRGILEMPEVIAKLDSVEKYVLVASTKKQICELTDEELTKNIGKLFRFIAIDVGYNIPSDRDEWAYILTRLMEILRRYYSQMTLSEIKLAFELLTTGELDAYLPKDSKGNPEKKHYQQFNATYLSNVLNAYKKKQGEVYAKAYESVPREVIELTDHLQRKYRNHLRSKFLQIYLTYKYKDVLDLDGLDDMFCYQIAFRLGYAHPFSESKEDREKAYAEYMKRYAHGLKNKYEAFHVRKEGIDSNGIDFMATINARKREVRRAFDQMIEDEVNINEIVKFE